MAGAVHRESNCKLVCIQDAPGHWGQDEISRMFSMYGPIEDVKFFPNSRRLSNFVLIEFLFKEDAETAVRDHERSYLKVKLFNKIDWNPARFTTLGYRIPTGAGGRMPSCVSAIPCFNSNCTNQLMLEGSCVAFVKSFIEGRTQTQGIYCSHACYSEFMERDGRPNVMENFIVTMGRNGTGLLQGFEQEKITIKVDPSGFRTSAFVMEMQEDIK